jgi:hypothetical protein
VIAPADIEVSECNCSICRKLGNLALIVEQPQFKLLKGEEHLTTYTFHTNVAQHYFCSTCGVKSFYVPRSKPDGISVNVRCLDEGTVKSMRVVAFDGASWE